MSKHRWSGFPGAWCLDCGCECGCEVCMATNKDACDPSDPKCTHPELENFNQECPEPKSNRHNPYEKD